MNETLSAQAVEMEMAQQSLRETATSSRKPIVS
jgi:hypothetical protein